MGDATVSKPCVGCGRGFSDECTKRKRNGNKPCDVEAYVMFIRSNGVLGATAEDSPTPIQNKKKGRNYESLSDPHSTGRKRAAKLYPLDKQAPCEWQGKKECGGGRRPIIGCLDGLQVARHHGPVKNTTRNNEGNVHRICTACHNHWHELNDLIYDEKEYALLPHYPVPAEEVEITQNILAWLTGEIGKRYELASTKNKSKSLGLTE